MHGRMTSKIRVLQLVTLSSIILEFIVLLFPKPLSCFFGSNAALDEVLETKRRTGSFFFSMLVVGEGWWRRLPVYGNLRWTLVETCQTSPQAVFLFLSL